MKDFFDLTPVGRSRRLRKAADAALEAYDLDVQSLRVLSTETNGVFQVEGTAQNRYVIRVGRGGNIAHSLEQVQSETEWLTALANQTDLRIPISVRNSLGSAVTQIEVPGVPDLRNCVLFKWLPGRLLDRSLTQRNMEAYGALAGRLHDLTESFQPSARFSIVRYDRVFPFDEPVVLFDPNRSAFVTDQMREVLAEAADHVQQAIDDLNDREPMRVIHGDLHRWNVLIDGTDIAAFDFEDLMWGWPVQDLAIALYYLEREDDYLDLRAAFRAGYELIRPWPDVTGQEIDTFIAGRALVLANDIELLEEPEYREGAPEWMAGFEVRIRDLLDL
jgi:Ser/Thr protein kinase RdoA (MazF antagonist)